MTEGTKATVVEANPAEVLKQVDDLRDNGVLEPRPARQTLQRDVAAPPQATTGFSGPMEELGPLFAALAKAQGAFGQIERTLTARIKSKRDGGADYSFDYAPLSEVLKAVRKPLADNELSLMWFPQTRVAGAATAVTVRTMLAHGSGKATWCDITLGSVSTDPKDIGSAITYAERYGTMALLGIAPDHDDDGNAAQGREAQIARKAEQRPAEGRQAPAGTRVKVTGIQQGQVGDRKVWKVKTTGGDVWTGDAEAEKALRVAMNDQAVVALATEKRKGTRGEATWLVEIE